MKKSTKLLSVILAIVMIFSTMSVMASAYQAYGQGADAEYNSNDKGLASLLTDEQRASFVCDTVNGLLASANIFMSVAVIGDIDLRSLDALFDTVDNLDGYLGIVGGDIKNVKISSDDLGNASVSLNNNGGAVDIINRLLIFLNNNADWANSIVTKGSIDLGIVGNFVDLPQNIVDLIADIGTFAKSAIYPLGQKKLTNGIGEDTALRDEADWEDLTDKPTLDKMLEDIIIGLLTEPFHTTPVTSTTQNTIFEDATYGLSTGYIHSEPAVDDAGNKVYNEDGTQATYYYIYGLQNATTGIWTFSQTTTNGGLDKQYITHWDMSTALIPDLDTSLIDFRSTSLYTLVSEALPIVFNQYAVPALNGSLRSTLMEFCGVKNVKVETTDALHTTVYTAAKTYVNMTESAFATSLESTKGLMGTQKNLYLTVDGQLYYVIVDGFGEEQYRIYEVDASNVNAFYSNLNWEYQCPQWAELLPAGYSASSSSILKEATDIVGKILECAVKDLDWTYDSASEDNAHFEDNVMALVKRVVKIDPQKLLGDDFVLPANFDSMDDEAVLVMIAADVMDWLMPSLVLPENVTCLEQLVVLGVREFIAEILPEYNWDAKIAAATTDAQYLDIALSMGTTIGAYYLREIMALGTTTNNSGTTTVNIAAIPMGPDTTWQATLNYIVDNVIAMWLPRLTADIKTNNAAAFASSDGLLKLTAVLNSLLPGVLSLITGCSANDYAVDLGTVKDLLAGILNLQIEPIANKLYRNAGLANSSIYTILVTIIEDLFGGLGCEGMTEFTNIKNMFTTCLAQENPLEYLLRYDGSKPNTNLGTLIGNLIKVLYAKKGLWVQDVMLIVIQATGSMDAMQYQNTILKTDKDTYAGASVTIVPQITFQTHGIPTVYYAGGYKTGEKTLDGAYTASATKVEIFDFIDQNSAITSVDISTSLSANATTNLAGVTISPTAETKIYVMKVTISITAPDGTVMDDIIVQAQFLAMAAAGSDLQPINAISDGTTAYFDMYSVFIDEAQPLTNATAATAKATNNVANSIFQSYRQFYIEGYGNNVADTTTGAITVNEHTAGSFYWKVSTDGTNYSNYNVGATVPEINNKAVPFYWYWNDQHAGTQVSKGYGTAEGQQWLVDGTYTRNDFTEDFTILRGCSGTNAFKIKYGTGTANKTMEGSYIVVYNTYGLATLLKDCINAARIQDDYTETSWGVYTDALSAAIAEYYATKDVATFVADHTEGGGNDYADCYDTLTLAVEGLEAKDDESSASAYTPVETAKIESIKTALAAEDARQLDNKDYIAYRWWMYNDARTAANNTYWSLKVPSATADSTLDGVATEDIAAVTAAVPANYTALVQNMVVAPTDEQDVAAQKNYDNFMANLPEVDTSAINDQLNQIRTTYQRLISESGAGLSKNYLVSALALVNGINPQEAAYTAQSWAVYAQALADANEVNGNASAMASEIHKARFSLLSAYKQLVPTAEAADYTALSAAKEQALGILNNQNLYELNTAKVTDAEYTLTDAFTDILAATGYAVTLREGAYNEADVVIGGDDSAVAMLNNIGKTKAVLTQKAIDDVTAALVDAMANVKCNIKVVANDAVAGNTTAVEQTEFIIEGLNPGTINNAAALLGYVKVSGSDTATLDTILSSTNGYGTGAKVLVKVNADTVASYTVLIHGDVNGDNAIDAFDAFDVDRAVNVGKSFNGDIYRRAADVAGNDDAVTTEDYGAIFSAAVKVGTIAQS